MSLQIQHQTQGNLLIVRGSGEFEVGDFPRITELVSTHFADGGSQTLFDRRAVVNAFDFDQMKPFVDLLKSAVGGREVKMAVLARPDDLDDKIGLAMVFNQGIKIAGFEDEKEAMFWLDSDQA